MNVQITPIREDLIGDFHRCLDSVARERQYLGFLKAPPFEGTRDFVREMINRDCPQFVALMESGELDGIGKVVGWCDVSPLDRESFAHCGTLGMGIHRAYRGKGLGTRLMEASLAKAKSIGLERIELSVYASNENARALYRKMGFVEEGVKRRGRKLDGVYDDIVLMALFL